MRGRVQIYKLINDEQILIEDSGNMVVDKAGEIIVDALTISPSLSGIASASAILDTSNYTIQAISFGKDAAGYSNHAHAPGAASANCLTDGKIRVLTPEVVTVSSYHSSAITTYANGTIYNLLPEAPTPLHERLETKSTLVSAVNYQIDTGHNLNFMKDPPVTTASTSSIDPASALVGCFAPSGGIDWNIIPASGTSASPIVSGTFNGHFNTCGTMDLLGYVGLAKSASSASLGVTAKTASGLILSAADNFSSTGKVTYGVVLSGGDTGCAGLFGGIYNIGLWALDMNAMLQNSTGYLGKTPPYVFSGTAPLGSTLKYRLFARKTLTKDITYIKDSGVSSGYYHFYAGNGDVNLTIPDLLIKWSIYF